MNLERNTDMKSKILAGGVWGFLALHLCCVGLFGLTFVLSANVNYIKI